MSGMIRIYFRDNTFKTVAALLSSTVDEICNIFAKKIEQNLKGKHFSLILLFGGKG